MLKRILLGICLLAHCMAHGEISWSDSATTISGAGSNFALARVNATEQMTAVWIDGNEINYANHTAGGWSAAATAVTASSPTTLKLQMNDAGQTFITWIEGGTTLKYATRISFAAAWSAEGTISSSLSSAVSDLALNGDGDVVIGWLQGAVAAVTTTYTFADSTFSGNLAAVVSSVAPTAATSLRMALGTTTKWALLSIDESALPALLAWRKDFGQMHNDGEAFFLETNLGVLNTSIASALAINTGGSDGIAVKLSSDGSSIFSYYHAGFWSQTASTVKSSSAAVTSLSIDLNNAKRGVVAWTELDGGTYAVKVAVATVSTSTTWSTRTITTSTNALTGVQIQLDSRGEGILAWNESVAGTSVVKASSLNFTQSGSFIVQTASDTGNDSVLQSLASNENDDFVILWRDTAATTIVARTGTLGLSPPTGGRGAQRRNKFLFQTEFYNHLTWTASLSPSITTYNIYANGNLVGQSSTTHFDHRGQKKNRPVTYTISSINTLGEESAQRLTIVAP